MVMGARLGLVLVLGLEDLRIDSLIRQAASISLEKEGKDKFSGIT